ncbi:MAG: type II secretion system protein [Planctomycetota bacterium]|nr:type II secretion system protein [Planctomycetota bacterium]MDI6787220.1 type II secretion system protein [Planctomycetota bacterium]
MIRKNLIKITQSGFTLVELLVTIGLMTFIMVLIATIFSQTITTVNIGTDQLDIYTSARSGVDFLVSDIKGCLPVENKDQRFTLAEDKEGEHIVQAQDRISFRAVALVTNQLAAAEIEYYLVEETAPSFTDEKGQTGRSATIKTKRPLYVLRRNAKDFNGQLLDFTDLCHYVLSFNIECFDSASKTYKQINEVDYTFPIGDGNPEDEQLPSGLRITLRVVANAAERQERIISRVIWIPMGE